MNRLIVSLLLLGALGCDAKGPGPMAPPPTAVTQQMVPNMPDGHPDLPSLQVLSANTRRLSVDQLERALDALGNLPKGTVKLPDSLALTLGRPDYLQVTDETLDPSPLFMKFMMDLGQYFCSNIAKYDPQRPVEQRVLTRYDDPEQNLRYMILRFTGIEGDPAGPYVGRLTQVYDATSSGAMGSIGGWQAVCLALFTSPEFLLY
jgi:hypothetical protein